MCQGTLPHAVKLDTVSRHDTSSGDHEFTVSPSQTNGSTFSGRQLYM